MWNRFINEQSKKEQDELLNELYKQMFIVAYSKMGNKADALDVVQESWVKILKKIDTLKDKDKLIQWAKTIVSNTAINILKKKALKYEVLVFNELLDNTYYNKDEKVEDKIENQITLDEIYENLKKFDVETRKIIAYKYFFGWKDQQIADELKIPAGTVKAKLHRVKGRLRTILNNDDT